MKEIETENFLKILTYILVNFTKYMSYIDIIFF